MPRANDQKHRPVVLLYQEIQVGPDENDTRARSPVTWQGSVLCETGRGAGPEGWEMVRRTKEARLDMMKLERLVK